jgi:hypothetical protein
VVAKLSTVSRLNSLPYLSQKPLIVTDHPFDGFDGQVFSRSSLLGS